ncbi:MAG: Arm DNA-binding domain-containing protein, partial [Desulfuromonadaceae bacterium]
MAKKFSDKYLASLKPKEKSYKVREAKGFAIFVLPSGTKTFLFIYEVGGKRKQLNLGRVCDKFMGAIIKPPLDTP